jgi:hypothetical protein
LGDSQCVDEQNSSNVDLRVSFSLFDGRGQRFVIGVEDEYREQLCRLGLARVAADRMLRAQCIIDSTAISDLPGILGMAAS